MDRLCGPSSGVKAANAAGVTEVSFSQTLLTDGDKPDLFKGKTRFLCLLAD
jgi:hypothetical protein